MEIITNMAKYCKLKGMNKEEFNNFKSTIKALAGVTHAQLKNTNGIYKDIKEIFTSSTAYSKDKEQIEFFVLQELKTYNNIEITSNGSYRTF